MTAAAIAARLSASERGVRILCDGLTVYGFLTRGEDGTYGLTPESALFLVRKSPAYLGGAAAFLLKDEMLRSFEDLPVAVRTGGAVLPGEGTVSPDNPVWVEFAHGMANLMFPAAQEIAKRVIPATGGSPGRFWISPRATACSGLRWLSIMLVLRLRHATGLRFLVSRNRMRCDLGWRTGFTS